MARQKGLLEIAKHSPTAMGFVCGLAVLLPTTLVGYLLYSRSEQAVREEISGNLIRTAKAASLLVDPESQKTFTDRSQESTPQYKDAIGKLKGFVDLDPSIAYVYTCVLKCGEVYFILDPTPEGDTNHDGVDDKSHVMERYDDATPSMLRALTLHVPTAETEPSTDQWGTFVSGFAPIRDEDGNYVGIVGIDLTADRYAARLNGVRAAAILSGVVSLLLSLLVGIAGAFFQKRRRDFLDELTTANLALCATADSLDNANDQLRYASRRFEQLFNHLPVACFTIDQEGKIFEWNQECETLFGVPAHKVIQQGVLTALAGEASRPQFERLIRDVFADRPTRSFEWTDCRRSGAEFTVVVTSFPLYGKDGRVTGGIIACADVTTRKQLQDQFEGQMAQTRKAYEELTSSRNELTSTNTALSEANERLQKLAMIDGLTGVLNRRSVFEMLDASISTNERSGRPLSILMVDIDWFKSLNDTHGHIVGDTVLKSVAERLQATSRRVDSVGRFGGEEFIIVMPDTDADRALLAAERVRKGVADSDCNGMQVTVSIGVSTYQAEFGSVERFIDSADRAMYEAKRRGRNKIVHSRELNEGAA